MDHRDELYKLAFVDEEAIDELNQTHPPYVMETTR